MMWAWALNYNAPSAHSPSEVCPKSGIRIEQ